MAIVKKITTVSVGSNGEAFTVSNTGWDTLTLSPPYGTNAPLVTNSTTPNSIYNASTSSIAGTVWGIAPSSSVITIRTRIKRFGAAGTSIIRCLGCATPGSGGDDYIAARFRSDNWQIRIAKAVNGSVSTVLVDTGVTSLADGDYADVELRISNIGSAGSPNWQCSAWYGKNGASLAQVGTTVSITDTVFDQIGRVGFMIDGVAQTTGVHITEFEANDDTSSVGVITDITATDTTATVTYTGNPTHYRIDGGSSVVLGASPHTITGLTENTEYTLEIGDGSTWDDSQDFGTENPTSMGSGLGPGGGGGGSLIGDIVATNDVQSRFLSTEGHTGSIDDKTLKYWLAEGASTKTQVDAEKEYLVVKGYSTGSLQDRWKAYLISLGYTGSLNDMFKKFWENL